MSCAGETGQYIHSGMCVAVPPLNRTEHSLTHLRTDLGKKFLMHVACIRESTDSLCRDATDAAYRVIRLLTF